MADQIPKTMQAFAIERFGDEGRILELPTPIIGDDDVLVKVHAAAINPLDFKIRDGTKKIEGLIFPHILGQDCAGVVVQKGGGVITLGVGSEVFGAFWLAGAFAQYVRVSMARSAISQKPYSLNLIESAALPTPLLAATAAVEAIDLGCGQTVLVNGASGSVGSLIVQIAHHLGAHVVGTARAEQQDSVRGFGASEVIDFTERDLVAAVRAAHPDGIDAVIDVVSDKQTLVHVCGVLRPTGKVVSTIHAVDDKLLSNRCLHASNIDVFRTRGGLDGAGRLVDEVPLRLPIQKIYSLKSAAEAFAGIQSGNLRGKVVLKMTE